MQFFFLFLGKSKHFALQFRVNGISGCKVKVIMLKIKWRSEICIWKLEKMQKKTLKSSA